MLTPLMIFEQNGKSITDPSKDFYETNCNPAANDMYKMMYMSHEIDVKSYKDQPTRKVRNYKVLRVISPFEFTIEFDMERRWGRFQNWYDAMQVFYNDEEASALYKVRTSTVHKFRCYVHYDPDRKKWERVRVFKVNGDRRICEIFFCDLGFFRVVGFDTLMEIKPEFAAWTSQGVIAHLTDIQPVGGGCLWPSAAVQYFKQLVEGKVFKTIVMTRSEFPLPEGFPDVITYNGVVMVQRKPLGEMTIQAALVKAGFAEPAGVLGGYPAILELPMEPTFYPFTLKGFKEATFSQLIPPEAHSAFGEEENMELIAEAVKKVEELGVKEPPRGKDDEENEIKVWDRIPNLQDDSEEYLPKFIQERLAFMKFIRMKTPQRGYVQMQYKQDELTKMEAALAILVDTQPHIPSTEARSGFTVAVLVQMDMQREPNWYRAIVKQSLPQVKLLKVLLIDYALEMTVKYNYARYLPKYFDKIPCYAHRVHIALEGMRPAGEKTWTTDACETFRKYIWTWEKELPLYYLWRLPNSDPIKLVDLNQDIEYDAKNDRWIASDPGNPSLLSGKGFNHLKDNPLLATLYISIGVDIMFEILTINGSEYRFDSLSDMLTKNGYAYRIGNPKTPMELHQEIVNNVASIKNQNIQRSINQGKEGVPQQPPPKKTSLSTNGHAQGHTGKFFSKVNPKFVAEDDDDSDEEY